MSFLCGKGPSYNFSNHIQKIKSSPRRQLLLFFQNSRIEKTSLLAGSMTVEAAVVLPVFLFFFINLSASLEMIRLYGNLEYALHGAGNEVCLYGSLLTEPMKELGGTGHIGASDPGSSSGADSSSGAGAASGPGNTSDGEAASGSGNASSGDLDSILAMAEGTALSYTYVRYRMIDELGEEYLDSSPLTSGSDGLNYYGSSIDTDNGILDIKLSYRVGTPFDIAGIRSFMMAGRFYGHLWNGYAVSGDASGPVQEQIVYITENSEVYHLTTACTHLRLSVRPVEFSAVGNERNGSGGIYYPCEVCARGDAPETVYICTSGDRYHFDGECYTLTRNYAAVPLSEVEDSRRPCMRCGGK